MYTAKLNMYTILAVCLGFNKMPIALKKYALRYKKC